MVLSSSFLWWMTHLLNPQTSASNITNCKKYFQWRQLWIHSLPMQRKYHLEEKKWRLIYDYILWINLHIDYGYPTCSYGGPISSMIIISGSPVGWGCSIHRLYLCRGVRPPQPVSILDMTLNYLMVRLQPWGFGEFRVALHCHCSQVHFDLE